jgi:hypothetical protein
MRQLNDINIRITLYCYKTYITTYIEVIELNDINIRFTLYLYKTYITTHKLKRKSYIVI